MKQHIMDDVVAAALTLRLAGWRPEAIGGVIRSHRPASKLISEGILMITKGEQKRYYERLARVNNG